MRCLRRWRCVLRREPALTALQVKGTKIGCDMASTRTLSIFPGAYLVLF